jgi:hypothetical protein
VKKNVGCGYFSVSAAAKNDQLEVSEKIRGWGALKPEADKCRKSEESCDDVESGRAGGWHGGREEEILIDRGAVVMSLKASEKEERDDGHDY